MPLPTPVSPVPPIDCHIQGAMDAAQPRPNAKKIFVFCDGTGNKFSNEYRNKDGNSNVVKLYTALRVADDQVAYYHPGVGTMGDPNIRNVFLRFWSRLKGLAFGAGFQANVLDAYRYLMEVYNDGDSIYLFGFSRGAYTARALAGMLHGYGLLCRGNEGHLLYAWNMFCDEVALTRKLLKKEPADRGPKSAHTIERNFAFAETYSRKVTIRFMGIWDTVSSVGWIYKPVRLLDMAQNPIVQVGRHAVSIDERRAYYRDNLWGDAVDIDDPDWPQELRNQGIQQDIAQVWFPGAHSDIGGSYPQWEAAPANETLKWMIGELKQHGAELCQERIDMVLGTPSGVYSADQVFTTPPDFEPVPGPDDCLHESLKPEWWLLQLFPQQYYDKDDRKIQWRVPYGVARSIPQHAIIHGSAERRMRVPVAGEKRYEPSNLTLGQLDPVQPTASTTADLTGCFCVARVAPPAKSKTASRYGRLLLGWVTFAVFWVVLAVVAWLLLSVAVVLLVLGFTAVVHTPGVGKVLGWGLGLLRSVRHVAG